jgi:hypothetical protein
MLELNARNFLGVVTELRAVQMFISNIPDRTQILLAGQPDHTVIGAHVDRLAIEIGGIRARSAFRVVERLQTALNAEPVMVTYENVRMALADVESRFADYLDDIMLFAIPDQQAGLFKDATELMSSGDIVINFPTATFEIEESAKCLGLSRPTASAFHSMRTIEIGVRALAKRLGIPDPVSSTDRSWGVVLGQVRDALDATFPKKKRLPNTEGAKLEAIYVTLDAIKNPWRNATMHVETVYTEADAGFILQCTATFMRKLMEVCDENGDDSVLLIG